MADNNLTVPERLKPLFEDVVRVCTTDAAPSGLPPEVERAELTWEFVVSVETMRREFADLEMSEAAVDAMIERGYREALSLGSSVNQ